ncbi:MAG TPA: hypothetical protein P5551_05055 [Syntrophales bacterium]|nr:hypothetical protein [Syntrophales bacterium]
MGWFTVGAYFACFLTATCAAWLNRSKRADRQAFLVWFVLAVLMLLLGINKQLDLQSLFTEMGRQIAKAQGWFDYRRTVQFWFVVIFGAASLSLFVFLAIRMQGLFRRFTLTFLGLFFLLTFIIIRAASFYHFDVVIMYRIFGLKMNWVLELTGIFMIVLSGLKDIILITIREN